VIEINLGAFSTMNSTISSITDFVDRYDRSELRDRNLPHVLCRLVESEAFRNLLIALVEAPAFSIEFGQQFATVNAVSGISPCRMLRGSLNLPLRRFFALLAQLFSSLEETEHGAALGSDWAAFADRLHASVELADMKLVKYVTTAVGNAPVQAFYASLATRLENENPHAIYPTSDYRESDGRIESSADDQTIEAVMHVSTFSSIRIVDRAIDVDQPMLKDIYKSLGRCICLVDENVELLHGETIERYFRHHDIPLRKRVYRAMEVDKTIQTVEKMLGDFKALGVSRNEPVLIIGGGVLADTGGLACALYGRNTPYVMLATSIVAGIDAGPSPRTCCDGFGYKNLFGAYHPPVVSITDRFFFKTLRPGWLRHGIAEIIKMSVVKDAELFANLEVAQARLIETKFGTTDCKSDDPIHGLSQRILGGALRSYVAVEYDNLYETHQCRPHAYGHTWSPGFEIEAGLLHGHAVAICMGLGAYVSYRLQWISEPAFHRILRLMDGYGLSLWHDILDRKETIWKSQQTVIQKRGQNLVAPLPKGAIGQCGYLNELSKADLFSAIDEYKSICASYPRQGYGIDAHCRDVGLEDGSGVLTSALNA